LEAEALVSQKEKGKIQKHEIRFLKHRLYSKSAETMHRNFLTFEFLLFTQHDKKPAASATGF